jgi:MerR family transcriptional regulator, copper efflux regulator
LRPRPELVRTCEGAGREHTDGGGRHEHRRDCERIGRVNQTIRYYEAAGLIAPANRSAGGYRVYTQADLFTLRWARDLGFSIERIRRLLDLWQDRSRASRDVKRLALDHIAEIRSNIGAMTSMRDAVQELADACGDERPECPILRDLGGAAGQLLSSTADGGRHL